MERTEAATWFNAKVTASQEETVAEAKAYWFLLTLVPLPATKLHPAATRAHPYRQPFLAGERH